MFSPKMICNREENICLYSNICLYNSYTMCTQLRVGMYQGGSWECYEGSGFQGP